MTSKELVPGLAGVPAARSAVSFIDGVNGILAYRGHRIEVLAEKSTFEETAWLLLYGSLPTRAELDGFCARLIEQRSVPDEVRVMLRALPRAGHPMEALQASLAGLGMASDKPNVRDLDSCDEAVLRVLAATPYLVAAFERLRCGQEIVEPDPDLSHAANFLWMLNGEKPDNIRERVLDCAMVLHAEHTMNASTFAARVVTSTRTSPYTACSAAVGALFGPLHGGANERVLEQLGEIGVAENVDAWVEQQTAAKRRIMGFGHRVYKTKDPRAKNLQTLARELFATHGSTPIYDVALALEEAVVKLLGSRGIHPNVDFYSGIVYQKLGIRTDVFTPIFAMARVAGYLAHWREQIADDKLFRPTQVYVGEHDAVYVPIGER